MRRERRAGGAIVGLMAGVWVAAGGACTEIRRSNGEDCIKGEDCLSGLCSGLKCAAQPPLLDGSAVRSDASSPPDAAGNDAAEAGAVDSSGDAPPDARQGDADEAGSDGGGDAESTSDAAVDG